MKFKSLFATALIMAAALCQAAVPVLTYHRISSRLPAGETVISPAMFSQQMEYLAEQGYTTLSMDELVATMQGTQPLPQKPVVLTFDDGWSSVLTAVPILNKHSFKASFWIITKFLHETENGTRLDYADIKKLAENPRFDIQSHSTTHPWDHPRSTLLSWVEGRTPGKGPADVRHELAESKRVLEMTLRRPVDYFAWPQGFYNEEMLQMAKDAGYKALLTIENGKPNEVGGDVFRIKRVSINGACDMKIFVVQLADATKRDCAFKQRE